VNDVDRVTAIWQQCDQQGTSSDIEIMNSRLVYICRTIAAQQSPARFAVAHLLKKTRLCNLLSIPMDGYRLRFHPTSLSVALWIDPSDLKADEEFLRAYLRERRRIYRRRGEYR
jgi:hypothetical protein